MFHLLIFVKMFDYFKKLKLNKTHFDMSNYEPYTANFGELLPTYSDNVLAGDEWRMRIKEVIKTSPWVAPSMVKMSNSNYGFFTPYATLWEHWNDFITNMSSVQDVVLSAENKSNFDSVCKWPSIPANIVQLPLKIANGYAMPVFAFQFAKSSVSVTRDGGSSAYINIGYDNFLDLLSDGFDCFQIDSMSNTYLMPYTPFLYARLVQMSHSNIDTGAFGFSPASAKNYLKWIFFADEVSSEVNINSHPVDIEWVDVLQYEKDVQGKNYNPYYVKHPVFSMNDAWMKHSVSSFARVTSASGSVFTDWQSQAIPSLYLTVDTSDDAPTSASRKIAKAQADMFFPVDSNGLRYFNSVAFVNDSALQQWLTSNLPASSSANISFYSVLSDGTKSTYCNVTLTRAPQNFNVPSIPSLFVLNDIFSNDVNPRTATLAQCAISLPFCLDSDVDVDSSLTPMSGIETEARNITHNSIGSNVFVVGSLSDSLREHNACGYSSIGFLVYQCQKVSKLCDHFGFNIDAYVARGFKPFLTTEFNAFPFMAYSRIWNDYFRNSTLQSPELSYKHVNGLMFNSAHLNNLRAKYCTDFTDADFSSTSSYYYIPSVSGWVITLHNRPLEYTSGQYCTIKIDSLSKAFSLITGYNMSAELFGQKIDGLISTNDDEFFLPSYYNGLCVVKYKNIGRNVYTSGILEPTNGATIEEVPDTIIELRASEKLQKFWEDTAVARSVKKWYQTIFGTTPTHDGEDKPLLLGKASSEIQVGEILQQSGIDDNALGDRAGVALGGCHKGVASHYFNEHGFICVLSSVTMDLHFIDGEQPTQRPYHSYLDLPYAQFAHIGNQSLPNISVSAVPPPSATFSASPDAWGTQPTNLPNAPSMAYGNRASHLANATLLRNNGNQYSPNCSLDSWYNKSLPLDSFGSVKTCDYPNSPFSYTSRYALDKLHFDKVHGEFRTSMSHWVSSIRLLGGVAFTHFFVTWEFKDRNSDLARFFVDRNGDKFYIDRYNDCSVIRALPFASTPSSNA